MNTGWEEKCLWLAEHFHQLSKEQQHTIIYDLEQDHAELLNLWTVQDELLSSLKDVLKCDHPLSFTNATEPSEGIGYYQLEMYNKATEKLAEEVAAGCQKTRLLLYLGFASIYEDKDQQAKDAFLTVFQQTNDLVEKHFSLCGLGLLEGRKENIEEAISYFEKALTVTNNDDVVYNLGTCYYWLGKFDVAAQLFRTLAETTTDPEAYYWLGKSCLEQNDIHSAYEAWYRALEERIDFDVVMSVACEFEERGEFVCALHCYQRLIESGCNNEAVLHGTAWNLGLLDRRDESRHLFKELTAKNPDNVNVWISYLWLLTKWGFIEEQESVAAFLERKNVTHPLLEKIVYSKNK
ncbi:tetratricopeptide repeat protein [Alteribacter keqinensis]|uniref:Tetratricopeptide repeat protein n=1 Tax=Alteribacter keqinensis TaxID=2483800 RepID=A0A3M7TWM5_9BACI|nr:tetratricopeptide repeat protein [Alteribacter keqinensis]RNA69174.1 tetratricopeptide repeat protein [Alteribacter keqinensis]